MAKTLTQVEIDAFIKKLQLYKYLCSFGGSQLGPLKSAPKIEADTELKDVTLYETGSDPQASILVKNNVKITLEVEDVDAAVKLLEEFKKGDNVLDSEKKKELTLVPITSDAGAKTITLSNAYLQPGLAHTLEDGDDPNSVTLTFICRPDAATGKTFAYGE